MVSLAKKLAGKIIRAFNSDFVTVIIRGQRVSHVHIILQPSYEGDPMDKLMVGMRSSFRTAPVEMLEDMAEKIQEVK